MAVKVLYRIESLRVTLEHGQSTHSINIHTYLYMHMQGVFDIYVCVAYVNLYTKLEKDYNSNPFFTLSQLILYTCCMETD